MRSSLGRRWRSAKPYIAVIWLRFGYAGAAIIAKHALNNGLNHYVFVVYRHAIATAMIAPFAFLFERKTRPKMNLAIFAKILLLALLEPVIDQNLCFMGVKYTTAAFASALSNTLPAFTFILACIFRLEEVDMKKTRSQAKVGGTVVAVGGAMLTTLLKGPALRLPWTHRPTHGHHASAAPSRRGQIMGAVMISVACLSWACFMILQAITLKSYPAELSLTALICGVGTVQGLIVALVSEKGDTSIWAIGFDSKLLAYIYSGTICSGLAFYVQGVIMKEKGPVFVTAFSPLTMVIVAILGSIVLSEQLFLGSVIGAIVIVLGLYLVVWGKSKDDMNLRNDEQVLPVDSARGTVQKTADSTDHQDLGVVDERTKEESRLGRVFDPIV